MSKITVEEVYIHQKLPFPKTMKIKDIPRFRMFGDAYYQSFYETKQMKSTFKLPEKSSILDYSKVEKASEKTSNSKIEYGSYQNVQPLSRLPIFIHYSHDKPLPLFKNVT